MGLKSSESSSSSSSSSAASNSNPTTGGIANNSTDFVSVGDGLEEEEEDDDFLPEYWIDPWKDGLPDAIIKTLKDPTSPQYFANAWMVKDPYLHTYPEWRQEQRFALAIRYFGANGHGWFRNDHWLSYQVDECLWYSSHPRDEDVEIPVCDDEGRIQVLNLTSNNLDGVLPFGVHIYSVKVIDTSNNNMHGVHPIMSGNGLMEQYILSNNSLSGFGAAEAEFLPEHLRVIKIDNNKFTAFVDVPPFFMPSIEVLNLTGNLYTGPLPTLMGQMSKLTYLLLGHNNFQGTIPTQLGGFESLQVLDLSSNMNIVGTVPDELAQVETLQHLDISNTMVSGAIPTGLCARIEESPSNNATTALEIFANCSHLQCCDE